jgi:predicted Zn-dependent peptidase
LNLKGTSFSLSDQNVPKTPSKLTFVSEEVEDDTSQMVLAFTAPDIKSYDRVNLDVFEFILNGKDGRLSKEFSGISNVKVYCKYNPEPITGSFIFYLKGDSFNFPQLIRKLKDFIIDKCLNTPIEIKEIKYFREEVLLREYMEHLTLENLVNEALNFVLFEQELDFKKKYRMAVRQVTCEDVEQVIHKYLDFNHAVVSVVGNNEVIKEANNIFSISHVN